MSEAEIIKLSTGAQVKVMKSARFLSAHSVGAYHAFGSEVRTDSIIAEARRLGKRVSLPTIEGDKISFYEFSASKYLVKGRFGIMEPLPYGKTTDLDLVIVPGVAFDRIGCRLGYGKAYYDRFLAAAPTYSIGLAYSFQLTDRIPQHKHDKKVDAVATENNFIVFGE
jgi:5-formyltetrahydrofolate cyclo-ligase